MREHMGLFRGKLKASNEWAFGNLQATKSGVAIITPDDTPIGKYGQVDPETVGECTGMKDKNGKLIFEGDILRIAKTMDGWGGYYDPAIPYPANAIVSYDMCAWMWDVSSPPESQRYISFPDAWCHYECEVIGNIHDNHELLEVNK